MEVIRKLWVPGLLALVVVAGASCRDSARSRVVTESEVVESNERRAAYIDSLNIPEEQKKAMKERLGQPQSAEGSRGK